MLNTLIASTVWIASWYGPYYHGRMTANGEIFNQEASTAAHKTLPFGTKLKVCYRSLCEVVRINDRGPFITGRDLDISKGTARRIGMMGAGVAPVQVTILK
jgi:rare lipoprotein A